MNILYVQKIMFILYKPEFNAKKTDKDWRTKISKRVTINSSHLCIDLSIEFQIMALYNSALHNTEGLNSRDLGFSRDRELLNAY